MLAFPEARVLMAVIFLLAFVSPLTAAAAASFCFLISPYLAIFLSDFYNGRGAKIAVLSVGPAGPAGQKPGAGSRPSVVRMWIGKKKPERPSRIIVSLVLIN